MSSEKQKCSIDSLESMETKIHKNPGEHTLETYSDFGSRFPSASSRIRARVASCLGSALCWDCPVELNAKVTHSVRQAWCWPEKRINDNPGHLRIKLIDYCLRISLSLSSQCECAMMHVSGASLYKATHRVELNVHVREMVNESVSCRALGNAAIKTNVFRNTSCQLC